MSDHTEPTEGTGSFWAEMGRNVGSLSPAERRQVVRKLLLVFGGLAVAGIIGVMALLGVDDDASGSKSSSVAGVCDRRHGVEECSTQAKAMEKAVARARQFGGTARACVKPGHDGWYQWHVSMTTCD